MLTRIYTTAREVTRALDEIVWAVDPRHDTLDSLVSYMGKFAQDLLGAANIRCRLDLPIDLPAWPLTAEIRHNLFLAFKEALGNVLKHAAATEVRVSLRLQPDAFVLVVKDNGRGFAPRGQDPTKSGRLVSGHGVANMTTRLERIGGRCEIATGIDEGTSVSFTLTVPALTGPHTQASPRADPTSDVVPPP
jgi:signal transduction histidine kinase